MPIIKNMHGDANRCDSDHIILKISEYKAMRRELSDLYERLSQENPDEIRRDYTERMQRRERELRSEFSRKTYLKDSQHEYELKKLTDQLETLKSETDQKIAVLEEKLTRQVQLNTSLKRISKERANAQREIPGKKTHCGYVVYTTGQFTDRITDPTGMSGMVNVSVWKTVLQTPYDVRIPIFELEDDVYDDLINTVLPEFGGAIMPPAGENGAYYTTDKNAELADRNRACRIYRWTYRANFQKGFWELDLYHTQAVFIPEEYYPIKNNSKDKET